MPAKQIINYDLEGSLFYIRNQSVEGSLLFTSEYDKEIFLGFIKEYTSPPPNRETKKQTFTIHGKTYNGVPHLTKNYYKKIEVINFNLTSTQFHLILRQYDDGSIQNFIRSLCTRYSIYFNKRYNRKGPLFERPYKSSEIHTSSLTLYKEQYPSLISTSNYKPSYKPHYDKFLLPELLKNIKPPGEESLDENYYD